MTHPKALNARAATLLRNRLKTFHQSKNALTIAAACAAAGVTFAMSPSKALEWTMSFCGPFTDGGSIYGLIKFDPSKTPLDKVGAVIDFTARSTTAAPGSAIDWTEADYTDLRIANPNLTDNPNSGGIGGGISRQYEFSQGGNRLYINIPETFYTPPLPTNFPAIGAAPVSYNMAEYRSGTWRMDIDDLRSLPVPAPLPILGAAAAFGSVRQARSFSNRLRTFKRG
jgi:hypothetical protein